jgi:mannose-6-phosphate isomerase-like protein (cupin superfamily)
LGDKLVIALNSDEWLINKKGAYFMPFNERRAVLENLSFVDMVIDFADDDKGSASNAIIKLQEMYPDDEIVFANGGDRNKKNIPEMTMNGVDFAFGIGGDYKKNSSSWILKKWKYYHEERIWGSFSNLFQEKKVKVKELVVQPNQGTSFQKHFKRNEIWLVSKGQALVLYSKDHPDNKQSTKLDTFDHFFAPVKQWHQITNPYNDPCHIIEIQYGDACEEDDIERTEYYTPKT